MIEKFRYLAHLFGPKCENEEIVNKLISSVLLDYAHWRRNYYPDDPRTMPPSLQRELEDETDKLVTQTHAMLAGLRRSFPFYSPRYIAHQQSETTIASLVGSFAALLYNSNNVTPESGIATVEWEIDACNALLSMMGYRPPPDPFHKSYEAYTHELKNEFGWCHLTSGGTVANIEALWVARAVKYFPLAVQEVCQKHAMPIMLKVANGQEKDIRTVDSKEMIGIRPNESIYLLAKLVDHLHRVDGHPLDVASKKAWELLNKSKYSPANGVGPATSRFSPVIFVSGAAHYSILKAADILGIGRNSVVLVPTDQSFRIDIACLREAIENALAQKKTVLAVVAIAGTTEEGAVDPLHDILSLRRFFEREHGQSFWVHVDAAWGGFLRSLFVADSTSAGYVSLGVLKKHMKWLHEVFSGPKYGISFTVEPEEDCRAAVEELVDKLEAFAKKGKYEPNNKVARLRPKPIARYDCADSDRGFDPVLEDLYKYARALGLPVGRELFQVNLDDRISDLRSFMALQTELKLKEPQYGKHVDITWPFDADVGKAIFAFEEADSITVDPHKMGYAVYPNGAVAFKNDRVRHLIRQEAPYITSGKTNALVHLPIRHAEPPRRELTEPHVTTQAFAPFTLEGSRPSTSACALWLSSRTMPFDRHNHGSMIRSSLLAARIFYEWIRHWPEVQDRMREDTSYEILHYADQPPDTNIVIFAVKRKGGRSIEKFNKLNERIYSKFSIQSELGRRDHSYSQPFFLSKTSFHAPAYPYRTVEAFLEKNDFRDCREDYEKYGLVVLRATIMNPYLLPLQHTELDHFVHFLMNFHAVAEKSVSAMLVDEANNS